MSASIKNNIKTFTRQLRQFIDKSRVIDDPLLCYAYATDASMYRMVPQLVVFVENEKEVGEIILLAILHKIAITFRAAGTSLCGQALTDQVLVVLSNNSWLNFTIHDHGRQISLEPGITGAQANSFLKPYLTRIGPDPASIDSCKIGGIASNNSSGMCCGVAQNTYQTMHSIRLITANGSYLNTGDETSRKIFIQDNPKLINGLTQIGMDIRNNPNLVKLIKQKFKIKNTTGYSLNAFIDFDDPIDILAHLIIGAEGTLGFISEITYNCIKVNQFIAVSLIYCDNLKQIIELTLALQKYKIDAIELLDITSLKSVFTTGKNRHHLPERLNSDTSAMLIEISQESHTELLAQIDMLQNIISKHQVAHQIKFTTDTKIRGELWDIRKGILPIIGSNRPATSTVVIEDVAVNITDLPPLIEELRKLFIKYDYTNAAIVGHILAGNIHFMFTPILNTAAQIDNYDKFMQEVSNLVALEYQGSLKAEHGTGRNMAAFVELEWGKTAYSLMWQIKNLIDPNHILNPGVILNNDPKIHIKNLKQIHSSDSIIDKCIECGFCESVCPSRKLTLSPRQRISTFRYLSTLKKKPLYDKYARQYKYYGIDTCATTGLCANKCPVGINTGEFILKLKQQPATFINSLWARHFNWFINVNRYIINTANLMAKILGGSNLQKISHKLHKITPLIPVYPANMPPMQKVKFNNIKTEVAASMIQTIIMYIPSCNNRIFADEIIKNTDNAIIRLLKHLGYTVIFPDNLSKLCCGQVFDSAGNKTIGSNMQAHLKKIIQNSTYPVLIDNSSCFFHSIANDHQHKLISIIDIINTNSSKLKVRKKYSKLAVHIDCSSHKLKQNEQIMHILSNFAEEIIVPHTIYCCGFAGNKGFTTPELNQSALSNLATQIKDCDIGVTFNRNCQIGLSLHGGKQYLSLAELVLNCTED